MGKILITCEKPDAAKNIANILNCVQKHDGYFENEKYIITWAFGHLIEWKKPEEINDKYKVWDLSYLPFKFDINKDLKVSNDKRKQYSVIRKLINRADVDYIVNAGDADREGLLIQEEIYKFAGNKKPVKVLWSQSLTEKEIVKCLNNLKNNNDFIPLLEAGKARSTVDYMLGYSYTRAIAKTIANNNRISYGRCQTPLLKLLSDRENEIKQFKVEDYFEIKAKFSKGYEGVYVNSRGEINKFKTELEAQNVINNSVKVGQVLDIKEENKKRMAPNLFSLPELQKEMGKKYHFTSDKTLDIAQALYEKKLTSYPRTDTEYINDEVLEEIDDRIFSACHLLNISKDILDVSKLNRSVKPNKVTGHHALLPTEIVATKEKLMGLTNDEMIVYKEICKRFIAIMMPDYEYKSIIVLTALGDKNFISKGIKVLNLGYTSLYKDDPEENTGIEEKDRELPNIQTNDSVNAELCIDKKQTSPPARYTSATIITLMEKYGIGRPSTMAEIIKTLVKQEFIFLNKNKYFVSDKGIEFISIIPDELKDPCITQNIEEKLTEITEGKYSYDKLIKDVYDEQVQKIEFLKQLSNTVKMKEEYIGKCPFCGSEIVDSNNKAFSHKDYKTNKCQFVIWKNALFTTINKNMAKELLSDGKTVGIFKKKDGSKYKQEIILNKETQKLEKGDYIN